jgi:uncharacterized membrane protein
MRNYIAVVFSDKNKAYEALHGLWLLDDSGEITVHGTTVVHRDGLGHILVDTKETHPALATAVGVGVGALLGIFAGPIGLAIGVAAGAGIGAAAGGAVGAMADVARADTRDQALFETGFVLAVGQSAVIADVSEEWTSPVDNLARKLSGRAYRRAKSDVRDDKFFLGNNNYFYPYEYVPRRASLYW